MDKSLALDFIGKGFSKDAVNRIEEIVTIIDKIPFCDNKTRDMMFRKLVEEHLTPNKNEEYEEKKEEI